MAGRRYRLQQGRTNEGLHALLWPVSRLLVRYIEANAADFRGARVLELGAGVVRARGCCEGVEAAVLRFWLTRALLCAGPGRCRRRRLRRTRAADGQGAPRLRLCAAGPALTPFLRSSRD